MGLFKDISVISQLMYIQIQVQEEIIHQEGSVNEVLLVTSVVLNAVLQEACHWVNIPVFMISID